MKGDEKILSQISENKLFVLMPSLVIVNIIILDFLDVFLKIKLLARARVHAVIGICVCFIENVKKVFLFQNIG